MSCCHQASWQETATPPVKEQIKMSVQIFFPPVTAIVHIMTGEISLANRINSNHSSLPPFKYILLLSNINSLRVGKGQCRGEVAPKISKRPVKIF